MTAEIAILNKSAVALASDSAVTITTSTGPKIYDSVNKLFALVKGQPVGIMIYDAADLMDVPWETIIKAYRMQRRGGPFQTLQEYADDFLKFVRVTPQLISPELQERYFEGLAERRMRCVLRRLGELVQAHLQRTRQLSKTRLRQFIDEAIVAEEGAWAAQSHGAWAADVQLGRLDRRYRARMNDLMDRVFEVLPLLVRQRTRLRRLILDSTLRTPYWQDEEQCSVDPRSGVVIAGFGSDEYFPRLLDLDITGMVDGVLRVTRKQEVNISAGNAAVVAPFAQREMVDAFVTGVNPAIEQTIRGFWQGIGKDLPEAVASLVERIVKGATQAELGALKGPLSSLVQVALRELDDHLNRSKNVQVSPILDSVEYLPKDELAAMAESLVNLTSLKRRISIDDPQTVGGPIDVAVISRGDGFVWIKRKHYFSSELNPSWASKHADG
jgi:hypothetical protein